jgi:hypothetical protein
MAEQSKDMAEARHAVTYYGHFMTDLERLANRHLSMTIKQTRGRSDLAAQAEAKHRLADLDARTSSQPKEHEQRRLLSEWLSDDPDVLFLAREGFDAFVRQTGRRILEDHQNEITLNRCPRCQRVARTPTAKQCRFCLFDWHQAKKA